MLDLRVEKAINFWKSLEITSENNRESINKLRLTLPLLSAKVISVRHGHPESDDLRYENYIRLASQLDQDKSENIYSITLTFLEALEERFPQCNYKANLPDFVSPETLYRLKQEVGRIDYNYLPYIFDYGISLAIELEGLSIKKHYTLVSEFSAPLTAGLDSITEVDPTAGDLLFRSAGSKFQSLEEKRYKIIKTHPAHAYYLHLRYSTFDIDIFTEGLSRLTSHARQFVLIDPPFPPTTGSSLFISEETPKSSLELLTKITQKTSYDIAVSIIPRMECTQQGLKRELRQRLIDGGKIVAVVEFSSFNKFGNQKLMTALVTSDKDYSVYHRQSILFIDATALRSLDKSENFSYMEFAAEIVKSWALELWPEGGAYHFENQPGKSSKIASNIFDREFGDGYKDVPGLCKAVEIEHIKNSDYKLSAKPYIGVLDKSSKLLSKINSTPVIEKLMENSDQTKRIYVIGNNGEGKSLLLFDLVEQLCKLEKRSVGIAFAIADRFPSETSLYQGFTYAGARNQGNTAKSHSSKLARLIKDIFCNQDKLACFQHILTELGFSGTYHLIGPHKSTIVKGSEPILLALSFDPIDNAEVFTHSSPHHTLGLMRETDENQVVPFSELSSGEQQVLSLIIKTLSHAENYVTFLIDEPEISLHVRWQSLIPSILEKISTTFRCNFVVATHSPLLIASANHSNDFCFVANEQKLKILPSNTKNTVEGVLFDNFKTNTPNNRKIPERCAQLVSTAIEQANSEDISLVYFGEAIAELDEMIETVKLFEPLNGYSPHSQITLISSAKSAIQELSRLSETGTT